MNINNYVLDLHLLNEQKADLLSKRTNNTIK